MPPHRSDQLNAAIHQHLSAFRPDIIARDLGAVAAGFNRPGRGQVAAVVTGQLNNEGLLGDAPRLNLNAEVQKEFEWVSGDADVPSLIT